MAAETTEQSIRALFGVIDQQLWSSLPDYLAADVLYERPGYPPLRGLAEGLHFYEEIRIIAYGRHQIEHVVAQGEVAACWGRFTGMSRGERQLAERFADTYTFRHGRIVTRTTYFFRSAI